MEKQYSIALSIIIASVLLFLAILMALVRVDYFLKIKAIDDCARISRYEKDNPDERAKITYPLGDVYKSCLKDKGY